MRSVWRFWRSNWAYLHKRRPPSFTRPSRPAAPHHCQKRDGEQEGLLPPDRLLDPGAEPPSFLEGEQPVERPLFVARERELAQLDGYLDAALAGQGKVVFVTGDAGSGKTALIQEFARRAQEVYTDLIVASGNCSAHTGVGDPYLPFREVLGLLTGNVEAQWAAGAMTRDHARRLWNTLPLTAQALVGAGQDLIDTFVPGTALVDRAVACAPSRPDWLTRLAEIVERTPDRSRHAEPAAERPVRAVHPGAACAGRQKTPHADLG